MKKMVVISCILAGFLLTGCTVDIVSSKAENLETKSAEFADKAEALGNEFEVALDELRQMEKKGELTEQDQKQMVTIIDDLSTVIEEFKEEKAPMLNWVKDFSVEKLLEREDKLLEIQEKAKNGVATIEDVKEMKKALSDDFEINLFGN